MPSRQGQQAHVAKGEGEELAPSVAMTLQTGLNWVQYCAFVVVTATFSNHMRTFKLEF